MPVAELRAKPFARDLFRSRPEEHLPCLLAAATLAEAGEGAVKARSDAWADRRVPEVLASPADAVHHRCWPASLKQGTRYRVRLAETARRLLAEPQLTVAVMKLRTLAERGGLLDELAAAGFEIQGPRWRD